MLPHDPNMPAMSDRTSANIKSAIVIALLATLTLGLCALNDQSLWLDELTTWQLTVADTWTDWLKQLVSLPNSDAQSPLYHFYMRLWVQIFPATEISLRAANLPWIFISFLALLTTPVPECSRRLILLIASVMFLHPMVWYYANEARPYAMMLAGSSISASGLLTRLLNPKNPRSIPASNSRMILGTAMLAGTSIIGVLWSISFLLPISAIAFREGWQSVMFTRRNRAMAIVCSLV